MLVLCMGGLVSHVHKAESLYLLEYYYRFLFHLVSMGLLVIL